MANGFRLDPRNARTGRLVYASNPKNPGVIIALLPGGNVRVHWLSGRISEQRIWDLYDFDLRLATYAADLADYQAAGQALISRPHPQGTP